MRDKAYTIFSLRKRNSQSKQLEWYPHPCNFLGNRIATTRIVVTGTTGVPSDEWHKTAALYSFVVECDAIYLTQTNTVSCSDTSITPLVSSSARQLTGLTSALPSRAVATDERGNATETWTTVNGSIVTRHRRVPYATNVAETTLRYGDVVREISVSGVTDTYAYDALGRQISHTDGRGNTTHTEYNSHGQRTASIDALGNRTTYAYDRFGNLAAVTNALGNAIVYEYDLRGRKTYEGGATYPVRYTYDVFGNKATMMTCRNESLGPDSGDVTTWLYDEASSCMTNKVYADGKGPIYGYTPDGRLSQRIWARGITADYSYDAWGNLTNTAYSDDTPTIALSYDALGRQVEAHDAAGTTTFCYDTFGSLTNETVIGVAGTNTIIRHWDDYGRTAGYALNGTRQTTIGYGLGTARIETMQVHESTEPNLNSPTPTQNSNSFTWTYLASSDLKSSLAYPNCLTASWTYDANDQLLQVCNATPTNVISQYDYTYDAAGRRIEIARSGSAMSESRTDAYGYNDRNELISGAKLGEPQSSATEYEYLYDDIGNRLSSLDLGEAREYTANSLNQYTSISNSAPPAGDFTPQYDLDGNQTLIRTSIGIWSVAYNGENRPVSWSCGTTNIVMKYDRMGRRVEYLETVGGSPSSVTVTNAHHRFVYDGYLCVQRLNAAANNAVDIAFGWDPTEPVATRPLWMQRVSGSYNFFYFHDGNKNVSDLVSYQTARGVPAHYEYAPFGAVTAATTNTVFTAFNVSEVNPYRFSSEYADDALGLVYYNYRHYEPVMGRWLSRDYVECINLYVCSDNTADMDWLGLIKFDKSCGEIEDYCRNDLEAIIAELDKIKDKYVMPKFQKRKNESTKDERERYQEWRREHQMDPLWKAILEIYKKRGLLGKDNTPIKGIWGRAEDVRKALKDIARELKSKNEPEVVCCPKDPTGKLCGDKSTSGGYMQPGSGGTFNKQYEGKIVICPAMMGKDNMIARNGGCGCFLMHELMHRRGMKIPRDKTRGKYERPIENAMIEIQQLILKDLSDRTCKGYDVK